MECLFQDEDIRESVTREEFEKLCENIAEKTKKCIEIALLQSGLQAQQIDTVEIVGGASRVPFVKNVISEAFGGKNLSTTLNADECVARGAALQAACLSDLFKVKDFAIRDFCRSGISLKWDFSDKNPANNNENLPNFIFEPGAPLNTVRIFTLKREKEFKIAAFEHSDSGQISELATYHIKLPKAGKNEEKVRRVKITAKLSFDGVFSLERAHMMEESSSILGESAEGKGKEKKKDETEKAKDGAAATPQAKYDFA